MITAFQPNAFQTNVLAFQIGVTPPSGGGGAWVDPNPWQKKKELEELMFDDEIIALLLCMH